MFDIVGEIKMRKTRSRKTEWVFEEIIIDLREVERSEIQLYDEYMIEIVKTSDGKKYYAKIYELVDNGPPHNNPKAALKNAVSLLIRSAAVN